MDIKQWMVNNLTKDALIIEAGTYNGDDTFFFSQHFNKIYAFEPIESLYKQAADKVKHNINVEVYNKALSDVTGKTKIHFSDRFGSDWGSSSLLEPKDHLWFHKEITFNKEIEVDTINLDDFIKDKNINLVDFVWLDIQGYEPVVLKAAPKLRSISKYIYTEVSLIDTYDNVIKYPEFKDFMLNNGYEIVFEDLPWEDMGNVLFKNKNL